MLIHVFMFLFLLSFFLLFVFIPVLPFFVFLGNIDYTIIIEKGKDIRRVGYCWRHWSFWYLWAFAKT
jgi:hypothetical protein